MQSVVAEVLRRLELDRGRSESREDRSHRRDYVHSRDRGGRYDGHGGARSSSRDRSSDRHRRSHSSSYSSSYSSYASYPRQEEYYDALPHPAPFYTTQHFDDAVSRRVRLELANLTGTAPSLGFATAQHFTPVQHSATSSTVTSGALYQQMAAMPPPPPPPPPPQPPRLTANPPASGAVDRVVVMRDVQQPPPPEDENDEEEQAGVEDDE